MNLEHTPDKRKIFKKKTKQNNGISLYHPKYKLDSILNIKK